MANIAKEDSTMGEANPPAQAEGPPAWLLAMLQQQHETIERYGKQMAENAAQQAAYLATVTQRLAQMEGQRQVVTPSFQDTASYETMPPVPTTPAISEKRPRPRLSNPEKFDGGDCAKFPQFEGLLHAKLEIDGATIGGEKEQIWYSFNQLSGEAAQRIYPWMDYAQKVGGFTLQGFFEQIQTAFSDPHKRTKALRELNRTKQGSQPLNEFLNGFNRLILEAQGWNWDADQKKAYLKAALSTKLLGALIGVKEEASYEAYCDQIREVNDQVIEFASLTARRRGWTRKDTPATPIDARVPSPTPADQMDWESTPAQAAAQSRTRDVSWASSKEMNRRKQEGLCFRCGMSGHAIRDCHSRPPTKPREANAAAINTKKRQKARSKVEEILTDEDISEEESENSGKE